MHYWGDSWPFWDDLNGAHRWITEELNKRTWCSLWSKEKYGTIRYEYVVAPGGSPYQNKYGFITPMWFFPKETKYGPLARCYWYWSQCRIVHKWQNWAWLKLWVIIQEAVTKWPHLKVELEQDIAIHDKIVGKEVHEQYWR